MSTEIHHRLKGFVKNFLTDDDDNYELIKSLVKSGKSRHVVNVYHFNNITPEFSSRLLNDPFTFFPPCEEALQEAWVEHSGGEADHYGNRMRGRPMFKARLGLTGWLGSHSVSPRGLSSRLVNKMVSVEGIVTRASVVRPKLVSSVQVVEETKKHLQRMHYDSMSISRDKHQQAAMPKEDSDGFKFQIEVGLCDYKDFQRFSIQEMPENAPSGELPRSVEVIVEEDLTDAVKPGDRVRVFGVYRCIAHKEAGRLSGLAKSFVVCNNVEQLNSDILAPSISPVEIRAIRNISERPDSMEVLARSIAPSICGSELLKRGLLLQLLGGTRKDLHESFRIRGDIHVLLIGDPSCGKSQMLRFMMNTSPLSLSTTGRGSSGVGLTAAVTVDRDTGERRLEAGAMVLADMGLVCIDEFDKMSPEDRVAIHEVMEQQTVTISKAGIQTSLNARCSVLAAANPLYGTFDEAADLKKQIAFPDSLLSRFDLIYVVRDAQSSEQDRAICQHVLRQLQYREDDSIGGPSNALAEQNAQAAGGIIQPRLTAATDGGEGAIWQQKTAIGGDQKPQSVLTVEFLRKYIYYCKNHLRAPILSQESQDEIASFYAELRQRFNSKSGGRNRNFSVPTARSLEACIRLASAHAKLKLREEIDREDVKVAKDLLLFTLCGVVPETEEEKNERQRQEESDDSGDDDDQGGPRGRKKKAPRRRKATNSQEDLTSLDGEESSSDSGDDDSNANQPTGGRRPSKRSAGRRKDSSEAPQLTRKRTRSDDIDEDDQQIASALSELSLTTPASSQKRRRTVTKETIGQIPPMPKSSGKKTSRSAAPDSSQISSRRGAAASSTADSAQDSLPAATPVTSAEPEKKTLNSARLRELTELIVTVQQESGRDNMGKGELQELVNQRLPRRTRFDKDEFGIGCSELQEQNKLMEVEEMIWFV